MEAGQWVSEHTRLISGVYLAVRVLSHFLLLTRLLHLMWHKMSNEFRENIS